MKTFKLGFVAVVAISVSSVVIACSSTTDPVNGPAGASSSSSSSGASVDSCAIPPATYTIHYTKAAGAAATCAELPDQTVDVQVSDASSSDDAGGCAQTEDKATCTFGLICTQTQAGATTKSESKIKNAQGTVTGTNHITVADGSGNVTYDCTYDFKYTKR